MSNQEDHDIIHDNDNESFPWSPCPMSWNLTDHWEEEDTRVVEWEGYIYKQTRSCFA